MALLYAIFATFWILISSGMFASLVTDSELLEKIELVKGLCFVAVTAFLLYLILREKNAPTPTRTETIQLKKERSIIALAMVLMLLVPIIGYGIVKLSSPSLEKRIYSSLNSVADQQLFDLELWSSERIADLNAIRNNQAFSADVVEYIANGNAAAGSRIQLQLQSVMEEYGYSLLLLMDRDGAPVLYIGDTDNGATTLHMQRMSAELPSKTFDGPESTMHVTPDDRRLLLHTVAPVLDGEGKQVAFLATSASPGKQIFDVLEGLAEPYDTLETFLAIKNGEMITALHLSQKTDNEPKIITLREGEDTVLSRVFSRSSRDGVIEAADHHGNDAFAVSSDVANHPEWQMVAKIDRSEAVSVVTYLAAWISTLTFVFLLAVCLGLILLWRQQRRNFELYLMASRTNAELKMKKMDEAYAELFHANPNAIWVFDRETRRIMVANPAAQALYGYSPDEFLGMKISNLFAEDEVDRLQAFCSGEEKSFTASSGIWRHAAKNGSEVDVELSSHRLRYKGRDAELVLSYDITERIEADRLLAASEHFARATIDALPLNIVVLDEKGDIIATNQGWRDFATDNGVSPPVVGEGKNYLEVCRRALELDVSVAPLVNGLEKLLAGESSRESYEYPCHSPDEQRWFMVHMTLFADGGPKHVVVSHENITKIKLAEFESRKLNHYYAALSEMNAALVRAREPREALQDICRVAATHTDLRLVTVVRREGEKVIADGPASGPARGFRAELIQITSDTVELTSNILPTLSAARTGTSVVRNVDGRDETTRAWYTLAKKWGIQSVLSCPIKRKEGVWGVINFYAGEFDYFGDDLVALFEELTADLAYCLDTLESERLRKEAEAKLVLNAKIIESTDEGLFIMDGDHRVTLANDAYCRILDCRRPELLGHPPTMFVADCHDEVFYDKLWDSLERNNRWEGEIWDRRKNGECFPAWLTITKVQLEYSGDVNYVAIFRDISERKEYEEHVHHIATHDLLTDLPSRSLLSDRFEHAATMAERHNKKLAVLFIDLDKFKLINDTLGHHVGDELLKQVADRIVSALRKIDNVCRVGGDEFIAVLSDIAQASDAAVVAKKIISELSKPYFVAGRNLTVTASIGIAIYPENSKELSGLVRLADVAMMSAKQGGQNRFYFYSSEMGDDDAAYFQLLNELRNATSRGELFIAYQPQIDLNTRQVIGVEALARWHNPQFGNVRPDQFIPIAEDSGLILEIGEWIMTEACRQVQSWRRQGMPGFSVSVNVSALQFRQNDFVDTVRKVLERTRLPAHLLELEVTESVLMTDFVHVKEKLLALHKLGLMIAIDDFGTGYSSLAYLRQFPAHRLKIDKSFIADLPDDDDAISIALAIINLARSLGMTAIAEGVETEAQARFLSSFECQNAQGYLFAKPMDAGSFESWWQEYQQPGGGP